ncbi:MAG: hypothetical protein U0791_09015 [Gemmataceae bacterium]
MNPLEIAFPGLTGTGYAVTSSPTADYNCIGWAAGEDDRWWWPDAAGCSYWPVGVPRQETLPAFEAAFAILGFAPSANPDLEPGVLKIAIYARAGIPKHAARQLPNGNWTSKLGQSEDIEHELGGLIGSIYGDVAVILAKPSA